MSELKEMPGEASFAAEKPTPRGERARGMSGGVRVRVLVPFMVAIAGLIAAFAVSLYVVKRAEITEESTKACRAVLGAFQAELDQEANMMGAVLEAIAADGVLQSAFATRAADAQADARETGLNTAFDDEDYLFGIFETGLTPQITSKRGPLQGAYRVGLWYDPQPKDKHDGSRTKRDDVGFYLSFDQMPWREKDEGEREDDQGLGLFARYGFAHGNVNEIKCFWSAEAQYKGLIPTRDRDVLGFGVAQGRLARAAGFTRSHETVMELYYNGAMTPWLSFSPSLQDILNPRRRQDGGRCGGRGFPRANVILIEC